MIYFQGGPGHGKTSKQNHTAKFIRVPVLFPGLRRFNSYVKRGWVRDNLAGQLKTMPTVTYQRTRRRLRDGRRVYKIMKVK